MLSRSLVWDSCVVQRRPPSVTRQGKTAPKYAQLAVNHREAQLTTKAVIELLESVTDFVLIKTILAKLGEEGYAL